MPAADVDHGRTTRVGVRFFCESCGSEVKRDARLCVHCGSFFSSIRCPSCKHAGNARDFEKGCPSCGYAFGNENRRKGSPPEPKGAPRRAEEALPTWVYAAICLLGVCVGTVAMWYL